MGKNKDIDKYYIFLVFLRERERGGRCSKDGVSQVVVMVVKAMSLRQLRRMNWHGGPMEARTGAGVNEP